MLIRVTRVKKRPDGSAIIEFTYDKVFDKIVKNYYNKKKVTKKLIQKFIREGLINYANAHSKGKVKDLQFGVKE
jgi:hypothetical protein